MVHVFTLRCYFLYEALFELVLLLVLISFGIHKLPFPRRCHIHLPHSNYQGCANMMLYIQISLLNLDLNDELGLQPLLINLIFNFPLQYLCSSL